MACKAKTIYYLDLYGKSMPQLSADKVGSDHLNLIRDWLYLSCVAVLERPTLSMISLVLQGFKIRSQWVLWGLSP